MQMTKKLLSVFLSLIMLLGITGAVSYADAVKVSDGMMVRVSVTYDYIEPYEDNMSGEEPAEDPEDPMEGELPADDEMNNTGTDGDELPVSTIAVSLPNQDVEYYQPGEEIPLKPLLDPNATISILPPEEAYITEMDAGAGSLMQVVKADPASALLMLKFDDLLLQDKSGLDDSYVRFADGSDVLTLSVTCSERQDNPYLEYSAGLLSYGGALVADDTADTVQAPSDEVIAFARENGFDFDHYTLTYDNFASADVSVGDRIDLCTNAVLVASWKPYEAPPAPPAEPTEPAGPTEPDTPENPTPSEPVNPTPSEPVNPAPSEPVNPAPAVPVVPDPVNPVNPNPTEPQNPNPPQPVNPNPPQPVNPNPPQPVNPNPPEPQNPNPPQPQNPDPVYTGPDFVLKVDDLTKVFDAKYADITWSCTPEDLGGYEVRNVVIQGDLILPSAIDASISSFELYDADGKQVSRALYEGHFQLLPGHIEITKRPMTVTAVTADLATRGEMKYAADITTVDRSFVNGYSVTGLLPGMELRGDFVTGSGTESFPTGIDLSKLHVCLEDTGVDVTICYDITTVPGRVNITDTTPSERPAEPTASVSPSPTVTPTASPSPTPTTTPSPTPSASINNPLIITARSNTWTYDGQVHTMLEYDARGLLDNDRIYSVQFDRSSAITNVGEQDNVIVAAEVRDAGGKLVPDNKYAKIFRVGKLYVEKRPITVTAISGALAANGEERYAARLSTPDGSYVNGFHVDGLVSGQTLAGDFVTGSGKTTFPTGIDLNRLRVIDPYGQDLTANYTVRTISGQINIVEQQQQQQQASIPVTVTAKSGTWTYDGNPHTLEEYEVTGLVNGDVIDKAVFKSGSSITDVGTKANEVQSVVIKSVTGGAIDASKYSIRYVSGTLTVTKFPLTLTAVSDSKVYDGKALSNKSVKSSSLANSAHRLSADYEVYDSNGNTIKNGPVDPGSYVKRVSNVKITAGNQDVTANYEIKTEDGTLTITGSGSAAASGRSSETSTAYYGSTYTIRSDAPYVEFQYLLVDGQRVPGEMYTVREGSTIITLKASYIQDLKKGPHNYSIVSQNKTVDGSFTVARAPKTSEGGSPVLWIILLLAAAIVVVIVVFLLKRGGNGSRPGPGRGSQGRPSSAGTRSAARPSSSSARSAQQNARPRSSANTGRAEPQPARRPEPPRDSRAAAPADTRQSSRSRAYFDPWGSQDEEATVREPAPARPQAPRYSDPDPDRDIISSVMNSRPTREDDPDPTASLMKGFVLDPEEFKKESPSASSAGAPSDAAAAPSEAPAAENPQAEPVAPVAAEPAPADSAGDTPAAAEPDSAGEAEAAAPAFDPFAALSSMRKEAGPSPVPSAGEAQPAVPAEAPAPAEAAPDAAVSIPAADAKAEAPAPDAASPAPEKPAPVYRGRHEAPSPAESD